MVCCSCLSSDSIPPGLAVNLLGDEHKFMSEDPCPPDLYGYMLGGQGVNGKEYEWQFDVSFRMMLKHCNIRNDLANKYPPLTPFQLAVNWAILVLGLVFFLVPGLYYLVLLSQNGDKTEAAAMLMAKRAYDLERVVMQSEGPDMTDTAKTKIKIIVHHVVCAYYQEYVDISNQNNPFTTFLECRKLLDVDSFLSENVNRYVKTYGWVNDLKLKDKAQQEAKRALSRKLPGRTTSMMALAAVIIAVYVLLLVAMSFTGNMGLIIPGIVLLVVDIVLTILYLGTWVPVTRRVVGLTTDTFSRWEKGQVHEDEIAAVTDFALLAIRYSEAEYREEAKVSEHKWIQLLHPSERPKTKVAAEGTERSQSCHVHVTLSKGSRSDRVKSDRTRTTGSHSRRSQMLSQGHSARVPLAQHVHAPRAGHHSQSMLSPYAEPNAFGAVPMARNAESLGWTQSQLAEAYETGYRQGRQKQNPHTGPTTYV